MKHPLKATLAVCALMIAAPAAADIIQAKPSDQNGTTVHNGGSAQGSTVLGELGQGSGIDVIFTGSNTQNNDLRLSNGQGQATITGALNTSTQNPNDTYGITSFNVGLENTGLFNWIEMSLMGSGTVSFSLLDNLGNIFTSDGTGDFIFDLTNGQNKFAFQAVDGQSIAGLSFDVTGGTVSSVSQIRIGQGTAVAAVPEPATWAMALLGFGAIGFAMRRKRRPTLTQMA